MECVNLDFAFEDNFINGVQFLKYKRGSRRPKGGLTLVDSLSLSSLHR